MTPAGSRRRANPQVHCVYMQMYAAVSPAIFLVVRDAVGYTVGEEILLEWRSSEEEDVDGEAPTVPEPVWEAVQTWPFGSDVPVFEITFEASETIEGFGEVDYIGGEDTVDGFITGARQVDPLPHEAFARIVRRHNTTHHHVG